MVQVPGGGPPVVVCRQLAVLPTGAEEEAGPHQEEAGGVALHVGVVRPVGQQVTPALRVQALPHGPEHDVSVIIPSHKSV